MEWDKLDPRNNLHSFCYWHYNYVLLIGNLGIYALDLQEKLLSPSFAKLRKFIWQMRQTWILVIIFILFFIWHYNHVLLIEIHDIDALVWQEKLSFPPFSLELKFIYQLRQITILVIISVLFMIGQYNKFSSLGYTISVL